MRNKHILFIDFFILNSVCIKDYNISSHDYSQLECVRLKAIEIPNKMHLPLRYRKNVNIAYGAVWLSLTLRGTF